MLSGALSLIGPLPLRSFQIAASERTASSRANSAFDPPPFVPYLLPCRVFAFAVHFEGRLAQNDELRNREWSRPRLRNSATNRFHHGITENTEKIK